MIISNVEIVYEQQTVGGLGAGDTTYSATICLVQLTNIDISNLRNVLGRSVDVVATRTDLPPYEFMPTKTFQKPIESKPRKIVNAIKELEI